MNQLKSWQIAAILIMQVFAYAQTGKASSSKNMEPVDCSSVQSVEVLCLSYTSTFIASVTPDDIRRNYDYKVVLINDGTCKDIKSIYDGINHAIVRDDGWNIDIRRAIIGYDNKGNRVFDLYIDCLSNRGLLNNKPVFFEPLFKQWINDTFVMRMTPPANHSR